MKYPSDIPGGAGSDLQPATTSTGLLDRLRVADANAWERMSRLYGPLVYRWARGRGLQKADAQNIVQDVFMAVLQGIAGFQREKGGFRAWLWGITYHKLLDHWQRQQDQGMGGSSAQEHLLEMPAPGLSSSESATPGGSLGGLYARALEMVRAEFEDRTWKAFWGVVVEGRDTAAIAADLQMTPNAVRIAKARVLGRLRAELGEVME